MPTTRLRGSASDPLASECQATADEADYQPHFQPPIAVVSEVIVITPSSARADSNPAQPMEQETAPLSGEPLTAFRRYLWLIRRILMHDHRLSSHDAEDLAQDIFLAMAEGWNRRRQKDEGATIAWIRTIVRHIALNHGRQSKRRPRTGFEQELLESILVQGSRESTLDRVIDNELQARMRYAIGKLPEPMRETVILWSETDMTIPEIAHSLGCSPRTVTLRMERVRAMLRRKLTLLTDGDGSSSIRARVARRPPGSVRNKTARHACANSEAHVT